MLGQIPPVIWLGGEKEVVRNIIQGSCKITTYQTKTIRIGLSWTVIVTTYWLFLPPHHPSHGQLEHISFTEHVSMIYTKIDGETLTARTGTGHHVSTGEVQHFGVTVVQ